MDNVYLGVWTNWSNGTIMGATLTTTRDHGNLLIALTGFLVPFVASRFWTIFCLVLHQYLSTSEPRDALHHQRQVILRNSFSPDSGLYSLFSLLWAWRGTRVSERAKRYYSRLLPIITFAICCISAFTVAGAFSSQISSSPGDEVLIVGNNCGVTYIPVNFTSSTTKPFSVANEKLNDAANYAQQCYSANSSGILGCDRFIEPSLPTSITNGAYSCPFESEICRTDDANLLLDTGFIDSNDNLGLNAPKSERFAWRYVLQCAPLVTEGYTSQVTVGNTTWARYNYGGLTANAVRNTTSNYTYEIEDLSAQYYMLNGGGLPGQIAGQLGGNYRLSTLRAINLEGVPQASLGGFIPSTPLLRPDGDVSVIFLSGNGIFFNGPMDDDWYRATTFGQKLAHTADMSSEGIVEAYIPTEAASPMGCVEQWQWCNSAYPKEEGCGPLAGLLDSILGAAPFFNLTEEDLAPERPVSPTASGTRLIWPALMQLFGENNVGELLNQLGAQSLASQSLLTSGLQGPLPKNQWQLDVTNWFNTVLASIQALYVNTAIGTTDPGLVQNQYPPLNEQERKVCNSQKIRNSNYSSFSLFGLLFTYITGAIITVASLALEPILGCLQRRRKYNSYSYLEWTTNGTLQLHRLAQEELRLGTWSGCSDRIPVTKSNETMAGLDISRLDHPILAWPGITAGKRSMTESSSNYDDGKDDVSSSDRAHGSTHSSMTLHSPNEDHSPENDHGIQYSPQTEDSHDDRNDQSDKDHVTVTVRNLDLDRNNTENSEG
ncbi:uncharacterized protein LY89DRAFT_152692 [Mollisia scopiformis]|uniref:Uncharacterized protein n=1 Tax=Mollisia scopiformis TaxID=149040 RepID=A0A194X253_MOLSC|nr:uncharacterized protein LY89DRAFT_152692 [Mollisia scopiformis]KUJ14079.1 hypothetical protein LY89DRAFT_152692 [Mollisia scopiformis]